MDDAADHTTGVEYLMAAAKFIEGSGKFLLWETHDVEETTPDIKIASKQPGLNCCGDIDIIIVSKKIVIKIIVNLLVDEPQVDERARDADAQHHEEGSSNWSVLWFCARG